MNTIRSRLFVGLVLACFSAQALAELSVTRHSGSSVVTELGYSIKINSKSTLRRDWVLIDDSRLPLRFSGPQGITVAYEKGRTAYSGEYQYQVDVKLSAAEAITAFEVRFVVFDVFGKHQRTLSSSQVIDLDNGGAYSEKARWRLFSETDASTALISVGYVAHVRLADGRVLRADLPAVLREAQRFSDSLELKQLDRESAGRPGAQD